MKVLTDHELELLAALDDLQRGFDLLPYHIKNSFGTSEKAEYIRRIDELKKIVAIRAMLRDGDGMGLPPNEKQIEAKL